MYPDREEGGMFPVYPIEKAVCFPMYPIEKAVCFPVYPIEKAVTEQRSPPTPAWRAWGFTEITHRSRSDSGSYITEKPAQCG